MPMLFEAMFLAPPGPDWGLVLAIACFGGLAVGLIWLRRIADGDEDPDRSFWRYQGQRGGGSAIPSAPELPTWRWLVTRVAILISIGAVLVAATGPLALRRWDRVLDESFVLAVLAWAGAVLASVVGTAWILRIARRDPEHDSPPWRYRR